MNQAKRISESHSQSQSPSMVALNNPNARQGGAAGVNPNNFRSFIKSNLKN